MITHELATNSSAHIATPSSAGWTVEMFKAFWAAPKASLESIPPVVAPDIVGYWPGSIEPVRGAYDYWRYIVELLSLVPDFRVRVLEHASNGEGHFVLWEASGTGPDGPFTCMGCDRLRLRNGIVQENRVFCEHSLFQALTARVAAIRQTATN